MYANDRYLLQLQVPSPKHPGQTQEPIRVSLGESREMQEVTLDEGLPYVDRQIFARRIWQRARQRYVNRAYQA